MPLSNRQFDEFHRLLLYCCLPSNILYGNCGWLNALFSTQHNCPLQFVAWKGYQKRKEGREEQLWWLGSQGGERESQQHLKRNFFQAKECNCGKVQAGPIPCSGGASPAQTKPWLMGIELPQLLHGRGPTDPRVQGSLSARSSMSWTPPLTLHVPPAHRTHGQSSP